MKKLLVHKQFFILIFLLVLLIFFAAFLNSFTRQKNINQNTNQPQVKSNPQLEREYEKQLKETLKPLWQDKQISGLKEQILDLRVPAKYLELHLNLVFAFDLIEQGQIAADQAKVEEGLEKLNQLKNQYPWLD